MLKATFIAVTTSVLITTGVIGLSAATSSSASAQRGFGCITNASRCNNQLRTPRTFAGDRNRGGKNRSMRKKGKRN